LNDNNINGDFNQEDLVKKKQDLEQEIVNLCIQINLLVTLTYETNTIERNKIIENKEKEIVETKKEKKKEKDSIAYTYEYNDIYNSVISGLESLK